MKSIMKIKGSVMDPAGATAQWWNQNFFMAMTASRFIDPLFFFSLRVRAGSELCIETEIYLYVIFIILRSLNDLFYWATIFLQFRMAYVAPSSCGFGRGKLVVHRMKIALRYLRKPFWMDLLAALPVPQVLVWAIIPISVHQSSGTRKVLFGSSYYFSISIEFTAYIY